MEKRKKKRKNLERSEQSVSAFERNNLCKSKENNEIFFSCETYTREFIIEFGGSQVRYKLVSYCN